MVSIEKHCWTRLRQALRSISERRSKGPHRLVDVVDQKAGLPVLDHLAAGAEVHGDHGHARGIGFRQDQSESLRDGVQVQQRAGTRESSFLPATSTGPM